MIVVAAMPQPSSFGFGCAGTEACANAPLKLENAFSSLFDQVIGVFLNMLGPNRHLFAAIVTSMHLGKCR